MAWRDRPEPGGARVGLVGEPGGEMKWRVVMEVTGADGAIRVHEIGGGARIDEYSPRTVGLTLAEGKLVLAGAAPSGSGTDGGSLLPPAAMSAVRDAAADQGQAVPASCVFVRYRDCFCAPVRGMPLRCDSPSDPEPDQRDHARRGVRLHAR
jgi:hypothetical protein